MGVVFGGSVEGPFDVEVFPTDLPAVPLFVALENIGRGGIIAGIIGVDVAAFSGGIAEAVDEEEAITGVWDGINGVTWEEICKDVSVGEELEGLETIEDAVEILIFSSLLALGFVI